MGAIISHAYMVTGILPVRVAFPCLAQCLLGTTVAVPSSILGETLIDSLTPYEADIVKRAFEEVNCQFTTFSTVVMTGLLSLLSRFNSRQLPTPLKFQQIVGQVASYEFLRKPSAALAVIPSQYKPFWEQVGVPSTQHIKHRAPPMALSSKCLKMQLVLMLMRSESWDISDSLWGAWAQMPYETSCILLQEIQCVHHYRYGLRIVWCCSSPHCSYLWVNT